MLGRLWGQWVLALGLAVVGGASAIVKAFGVTSQTWLVVTVAVVASAVGVPAKVLEVRRQQLSDMVAVLRRGVFRAGRRQVGRVSDSELVALGVQPAGLPEGVPIDESRLDARMPGYVRRDQHEVVASKLCRGRFVMVLGDSAAGKSRLALEAMRATVPGHVLFAPEPSALAATIELMSRVRAAVLWLDDLDRYLESDAFTATAVDRLLSGNGHQRMIVATLRSKAHDNLITKGEGVKPGVLADRQHVLNMAESVHIQRNFTDAEVTRARQHTTDVRIVDALAYAHACGLAEYLAVGPQLRDRWIRGKETDPRGAALVQAALDCRRAGYITPLPVTLLNNVHTHYLSHALRQPEDLEAAWRWARERVRHTTALLEPVGTGETVVVFDYLLDHIQHTTPVDDDPPVEVLTIALMYTDATTATAIGRHAFYRGRYQLALTAHSRALAKRQDEHDDTLASRGNIALALWSLGQLGEAEQENRAVLAARIRTVGETHVDTLTSRSNLALVLADRWKLTEAEQENRVALAERTRQLGDDHPDTLTSRSNLALVLVAQGKRQEAEAAHRDVLAARTRVLGPDHPDTLTSRSNLAYVLAEQGNWIEAEKENRNVLAARTRVLGAEHPDTLTSRSNLGSVLRERGKLVEAERETMVALNVREVKLGREHPDTLVSQSTLALVRWSQGELAEAETRHQAVLTIRSSVLGSDDPRTLTSRSNRATVLKDLGRLAEAETEYRNVLHARMLVLGPEHPDTLTSRSDLALALWAQGRLEEAEIENRDVLETLMRVSGTDHPRTLTSRNNLTTVLRAQGKLDEAETEIRAVLETRTRVLGLNHPGTLKSRSNLASVLRAQGKLDEAETENRAVLAARLAVLGLTHPDTLTSRNNLALVLTERRKFDEAGAEHEQVLAERIRVLGHQHPDTTASRDHLAAVRRMG